MNKNDYIKIASKIYDECHKELTADYGDDAVKWADEVDDNAAWQTTLKLYQRTMMNTSDFYANPDNAADLAWRLVDEGNYFWDVEEEDQNVE